VVARSDLPLLSSFPYGPDAPLCGPDAITAAIAHALAQIAERW
jgi:hypothetical protein